MKVDSCSPQENESTQCPLRGHVVDPESVTDSLLREIRDELRDLDPVTEASLWWDIAYSGVDGAPLTTGEFSYLSVEAVDVNHGSRSEPALTQSSPCEDMVNGTHFLHDVMKEYGLVLYSVDCGTDGLRAKLTFDGHVHHTDPEEMSVDVLEVMPDE